MLMCNQFIQNKIHDATKFPIRPENYLFNTTSGSESKEIESAPLKLLISQKNQSVLIANKYYYTNAVSRTFVP